MIKIKDWLALTTPFNYQLDFHILWKSKDISLGQGKFYVQEVFDRNWVTDRNPCLYENKMKISERTREYKLSRRMIGLPKELLLLLYSLLPTNIEYN